MSEMSAQQKNVANLETIRDKLREQRREKAEAAAGDGTFGRIESLIEIQNKIEVIDRILAEERNEFDPEASRGLVIG